MLLQYDAVNFILPPISFTSSHLIASSALVELHHVSHIVYS